MKKNEAIEIINGPEDERDPFDEEEVTKKVDQVLREDTPMEEIKKDSKMRKTKVYEYDFYKKI